jgi:hypothetical protein
MSALFMRFRGILFNLVFLAYLVLVQPHVLRRLDAVLERGALDPLLGVLLLAVPWLELAGMYFKAPAVLERLRQGSARWPSTFPTVVWMAHLVLNVMLFVGFACFGVVSGDDPPLWGVLLMLAVVLKELFFLLYWTMKVEPAQARAVRPVEESGTRHSPSPYPARPWWSELAGDLLLLPFALLSFSCLWQMLVARNSIHYSSPGDAAVELALAVFVFLMLFAASRSLYVIEEWATLRGKWPILAWAASILLNLILAVAFLPAA